MVSLRQTAVRCAVSGYSCKPLAYYCLLKYAGTNAYVFGVGGRDRKKDKILMLLWLVVAGTFWGGGVSID